MCTVCQEHQGLHNHEKIKHRQPHKRTAEPLVSVTPRYALDHVYGIFSFPKKSSGSDLITYA